MKVPFVCLLLSCLSVVGHVICSHDNTTFDKNYNVVWASDHTQLSNQNTMLQLTCDQASGAAFQSNQDYGSGFFHMRIKWPSKDSAAVITTYYLRSYTNAHDEIDFEFIGNSQKPYLLHTNIFVNGQGNREQQFSLWFDPTIDFHSYLIIWNQHQVVWFVDDIPIRVFKNNSKHGLDFPTQAMKIEGSIWHAEWASGGRPVNWNQAPFQAQYQGFDIAGCPVNQSSSTRDCHSQGFWWNRQNFWDLNLQHMRKLKEYREKYMSYDYCSKTTDPKISLECQYNQVGYN